MTAVVLGAGRGIGREIARQLVAEGREVRALSHVRVEFRRVRRTCGPTSWTGRRR
jgi:NAD(P)-dependent dehydrogenase (short-subunit alcohol dehydrogenase family)